MVNKVDSRTTSIPFNRAFLAKILFDPLATIPASVGQRLARLICRRDEKRRLRPFIAS